MDFPDITRVFNYKEVEGYYGMQLQKASWAAACMNLLIVVLVTAAMQVLLLVLQTALSGVSAAMTQQPLGPTAVAGGMNLVFLGVGAAASFAGFFLFGLLLHLIAKALGGRGSALQLIYLMSVSNLAMVPVSIALQVLSFVPCLCCVGWLLGIALGIYGLYLTYLSVKVAHQLEGTKALIALVLWMVVVVAIIIALYLLLAVFLFGSMLGVSQLLGMK